MDEEDNVNWEVKIVEVVSLDPGYKTETPTNKSNEEEQPLLKLIKNLVDIVDNEEKTVLPNSQLMDILQKEFEIDIVNKSELEVDIYLNILKKFLKSWPKWDELDTLIKNSKTDPNINVNDILAEESKSLKTYLTQILSLTSRQMKPVLRRLNKKHNIKKMQEEENEKSKENEKEEDIVMEISCSRSQLDALFYSRPYNKTIFNITQNTVPKLISLNKISLTEILNWPGIQVSISLPWIDCTRRNSSHFERVLRNLRLPKDDITQLPQEVYCRNLQRKNLFIKKLFLVKLFNDIKENIESMKVVPHQVQQKEQILSILTHFKHDFVKALNVIALGAEYQFFLNRYKYVRHFWAEPPLEQKPDPINDGVDIDFDLRLEESISPAQIFRVTELCFEKYPVFEQLPTKNDLRWFWDNNTNWLKIECGLCDVRFDGFIELYSLVQHFAECHSVEKDWICQYCRRVLSMQYLTFNRWHHNCGPIRRHKYQ